MKELIEQIAKALVDNPEQVSVRPIEGEQAIVFELRVAQSDIGKVIGKQGRTARSIRTILSAAGMKLKKRCTLEILEWRSISHHSASFISIALSISRTGPMPCQYSIHVRHMVRRTGKGYVLTLVGRPPYEGESGVSTSKGVIFDCEFGKAKDFGFQLVLAPELSPEKVVP